MSGNLRITVVMMNGEEIVYGGDGDFSDFFGNAEARVTNNGGLLVMADKKSEDDRNPRLGGLWLDKEWAEVRIDKILAE
jgi:hypothetical protein